MPFCPKCGTSNPDGARFCQSCGTAMPAAAGAPIPPAGVPPAVPGPAAYAPPPQVPQTYAPPPPPGYAPGYAPAAAALPRRKNPRTAAALGLFWGLGAQAFYNGQPLKAVVQIIVNFLFAWRIVQNAAWSGGQGAAWIIGLAIASIFMVDGYKVAKRINAGIPVGPWTFF